MDYRFEICEKSRMLFERFIKSHSLEGLNEIPDGFSNNIIWNIGHIIATQQLLTYGLSGETIPVDMDFINTYKKGSKPEIPISQDGVDRIHKLLFSTATKLEEDYKAGLFTSFKEYTLSTSGSVLKKVEHAIDFNNFHEGLHLGCCIQLSKLVKG